MSTFCIKYIIYFPSTLRTKAKILNGPKHLVVSLSFYLYGGLVSQQEGFCYGLFSTLLRNQGDILGCLLAQAPQGVFKM